MNIYRYWLLSLAWDVHFNNIMYLPEYIGQLSLEYDARKPFITPLNKPQVNSVENIINGK